MPITTTFSSAAYQETAMAILIEHLRDYFPPASHIIVDEPPSLENLTKPLIWLQVLPGSRNLSPRTRRGGKTLQQKRLVVAVTLATTPTTGGLIKAQNMATVMERNAILRDGYKLGQAGLRQAQITPFADSGAESQPKMWRKIATLSFEVYVEAT